ncbi:endopolygalacturonase [Lentzea sp. NBRC 105346]|uniref:glycoside hydrolase family 28 protein n=1 Tax=Lentzea sp. NBRC 105346 TaxID=3032205 RepID=UPI0024A09E52|nr:glycoside hydrolase family 28 protein [Lentzea sp. NBRC 105346]GLZ33363.1 endopolygalacturonase [Lentzea sp. NBRC 105346]
MDGRINRRLLLKSTLVAAVGTPLLAQAAVAVPKARVQAVPTLPWPEANEIVKNTKLPSFPDKNFNVMQYGAKNDGKTDNTDAFRKAIGACNEAGGGHVIVPSGTYVTGAVHLLSNVDFHLEAGAVLKFSGDASKFPVVLTRYEGIECMNRSPMVYAYKQTNIAITGKGTLDAGATGSWNKGSDRKWLEGQVSKPPQQRVVPGNAQMRSTFVEPYSCDTVLIQGITLKNPKFWQIHPTLCKNVTVDDVHTDPSTASSNTDACDPESCDHVVISNSDLGAHDDNVAIKSGRDEDGRRINVPCQNLVVVNCRMNGNWGAITCGSEQTGGIRNVYAYKLNCVGATKFALYVKSNTKRGGFSENINLDSVSGVFERSIIYVTTTYNSQTGNYVPKFGPFTLSNSSCTKASKVLDVSGLSNSHVKGLALSNCKFTGVGSTSNTVKNVDGLKFTNVTVNGKPVQA